jgi:hypothetical protein
MRDHDLLRTWLFGGGADAEVRQALAAWVPANCEPLR